MSLVDKVNIKEKARAVEILGVFTKHNMYINGFTPEEMRTTLEDLGPTYVKIGQIMSSRTDLLPESYCQELEKLRTKVQPLEASLVRQVIEEETGQKIEDIYQEFKEKPLGSASIGQAHFGILKDGRKVVTKVQRPLIADMMRRDFALLKRLARMVNVVGESSDNSSVMDLETVIEELENVTEEELNFQIEATNTRFFKENCVEDETKISCPTIIDELTTERILTMSFVDGYSLSHKDQVEADGYDRVKIGKAIVDNYLHQVLDIGTFHGDPHQGNIMISHGVPYWIDFGMVGHVSEQSLSTLQGVVFALIRKDVEGLTNAALTLGQVKGQVNKSKLMDDVDMMIDKYMTSKSFTDIDAGALMSDLVALLNKHQISVPGEYTMLIRSLATIEGVLEEFCPELNLFEFLTKKMLVRAKNNFNLQEQVVNAVEMLATTGLRTVKLPGLASDALKNLIKGNMKINLELTGTEEPLKQLNQMLVNVVPAIFSSVIFIGSCTLCTTDITPQVNGVPMVAMIGFILSISLGIYTIRNLSKK